MLWFALLQVLPDIDLSTARLVLEGRGLGNGGRLHGHLALAEIRDESFCEESHREYFFNVLKDEGLTLLLLIETDAHGTAEILFPKPYGERKSIEEKQSDKEADQLVAILCEFLAATYGRGWEKQQRIWKFPRVPTYS